MRDMARATTLHAHGQDVVVDAVVVHRNSFSPASFGPVAGKYTHSRAQGTEQSPPRSPLKGERSERAQDS